MRRTVKAEQPGDKVRDSLDIWTLPEKTYWRKEEEEEDLRDDFMDLLKEDVVMVDDTGVKVDEVRDRVRRREMIGCGNHRKGDGEWRRVIEAEEDGNEKEK